MQKKATPVLIFGLVIVGLFAILVFTRLNKANLADLGLYNEVSPSADLVVDFDNASTLLFSSTSCPHCQQVVAFLEENPTAATKSGLVKVSLDNALTQNTYQNKLSALAKECGLASENVGIPFLYLNDPELASEGRCLTGDSPIIAYFSQLIAATPAASPVL